MDRRKTLLQIVSAAALLGMLAACGAAPAEEAAASTAASSAPGTAAAQQNPEEPDGETHLYVTDIEGNTQDLAGRAWAKKYPFLLQAFAGESGEELTGFYFSHMAQENLIPKGQTMEYPLWGQTLSICVESVERGQSISGVPADKLSQGERFLGAPKDGQEYLAVTLTITNNGTDTMDLYLNNLSLRCCVDGELARGDIGSEAVTSDLPLVSDNATNQFEVMLEGGKAETWTVLFYVNAALETGDLYLYPNFAGAGYSEIKTADVQLAERWLALA